MILGHCRVTVKSQGREGTRPMRQTEKEETKKLEQTFKVPVLTTIFSKSYESYLEPSNSFGSSKLILIRLCNTNISQQCHLLKGGGGEGALRAAEALSCCCDGKKVVTCPSSVKYH